MTRARSICTGLAALAVLALAVIGLPVVLYGFGGSPLPHHIASWHGVMATLSSQDGGGLLLAIIRDSSWLAWLLFTGCVLAESQAMIRGRPSPYLRLGGLQGVAAHLVALTALAFAAPSAMTLSASASAVSSQPAGNQPAGNQPAGNQLADGQPGAGNAVPRYLGSPPAGPGSPAHPADPGSPNARAMAFKAVPATASRLVTVRSGDCLWSIAQRYLGGGDHYPEIVGLNYGHDMGDGQVFANPSLIEPGWRLSLPGSGSGGQDPAARAGSLHPGHPTKDPHYRRRHPAARRHAAAHHADSSQAGNEADRPSVGSSGRAGLGESGDPAAVSAGYQTWARADAARTRQLPEAAVFAGGALAGAVLTSLMRMRRRQRQERRRGRRIALPADQDVLAAEQRLRAAAPLQSEPVQTLRDALACLEAGIVTAGQDLPEIVGLHVAPDVLEVLLAAPAANGPPAPYAISPGRQGMCWQLELPALTAVPGGVAAGGETAGAEADGGGADCGGADGADVRANAVGLANLGCHLLPGLITAGATADGYLLLDLESLQVTGCDGPPGLVDQVVVTTATELATGQWSGWYELILVGCDELEVLGRAEHCATVDEALILLEARRAAASQRIAERAPADVRELRLAEPDNEDWGLTILISRVEPTPDEMMLLLELAAEGAGGIAALVAGDTEAPDGRMAPTVLQLAPDPQAPDGIIANVVPFQITVRPRTLSAADYAAITTLFAVADDLADVGRDAEPYASYAAAPWIPQAASLQPTEVAEADALWPEDEPEVHHSAQQSRTRPPPEPSAPFACAVAGQAPRPWPSAGQRLQVRILGPLVITGAAEQLQPKQAELVLALALAAPAGLSNSALCSMLGADPDHPKPADAVRQIITRTRRRLGLAGDGRQFIIHGGNGHYVLHPDATLDWSRFRELVASGQADDLRAAVSLIGGQPFTGSYFWWVDIPLIETVRAELVDAAEVLAEFELTAGSPRAAARAARAGLQAETSAEQLWRAVMRAEHAAGNLAGVTEAWRHCLDAIEDIAPDGEPHPDTVALYRQLTTWQHVPVR